MPQPTSSSSITYTKWYRVWERTSPKDFYQEAFIIPFILIIVGLHIWGRRTNKRKASAWIKAHAPALEKEFAVVGFGGRKAPSADDVQESGHARAMLSDELVVPEEVLKEKTAQEYTTYATGRQNIAFVDMKLSLHKRYNPVTLLLEWILSLFFESIAAPIERMEATAYTFDGREKDLVPVSSQREQENLDARTKSLQSSYDGFVWAIVNKGTMRKLREDRYDISLTSTKDNPKLPAWVTVMSESAEVTETLLTPDLIKAIEKAGDDLFENLIITDQPVDKPQKYVGKTFLQDKEPIVLTSFRLNETVPKKRLSISLRLPSSTSSTAYDRTLPLFTYFLRLPDTLVSSARFRPEVMRKIRGTRDEQIRQLKKTDDDEKAEERKLEGDKKKKAERDAKLTAMSAEGQKKYLERERERDHKKATKRMTKKG